MLRALMKPDTAIPKLEGKIRKIEELLHYHNTEASLNLSKCLFNDIWPKIMNSHEFLN